MLLSTALSTLLVVSAHARAHPSRQLHSAMHRSDATSVFDNETDFHAALEGAWAGVHQRSEAGDTTPQPFVACARASSDSSPVESAALIEHALQLLTASGGRRSVRTMHRDSGAARTCFIAHARPDVALGWCHMTPDNADGVDFELVEPLMPVLKFESSLFQHLQLAPSGMETKNTKEIHDVVGLTVALAPGVNPGHAAIAIASAVQGGGSEADFDSVVHALSRGSNARRAVEFTNALREMRRDQSCADALATVQFEAIRRTTERGADYKDDDDTDIELRHTRITVTQLPPSQDTSCRMALIGLLAAHPSVAYVTPRLRGKLFNNHAAGIVQGGEIGATPMWDGGVLGAGEVVGCADTGLDDRSCYFSDSVNGPVARSSIQNPTTHHEMRKVVQYVR